LDSDKRARNHHDDISEEQPLLINPSLVNPQEHIGFRDEIPYAVDSSVYGQATIDTLGLGRESLNEIRRTKLNTIAHLFKVLTAANNQSNEEWQEIAKQTKLLLEKSADATAEYSAMVSAYYSQQETTINLIST
jgi:hypothetical protein